MLWYTYYNWWTSIDTLVLTEVQSLHYRFTPCVTCFMGFGECMMSCIQQYRMLGKSHCPQSPLCYLYSFLLPSFFLSSAPSNHFHYLHNSAFSRMLHRWNHTVAFSDWPPSLRNMHLRFLQVLLWLESSFLSFLILKITKFLFNLKFFLILHHFC